MFGLENLLKLLVLQAQKIRKGEVQQTVSSTMPIRLDIAYLFSRSERKRKYIFSKMAAKLKDKRTSSTTMLDKHPMLGTFPTPLHSH